MGSLNVNVFTPSGSKISLENVAVETTTMGGFRALIAQRLLGVDYLAVEQQEIANGMKLVHLGSGVVLSSTNSVSLSTAMSSEESLIPFVTSSSRRQVKDQEQEQEQEQEQQEKVQQVTELSLLASVTRTSPRASLPDPTPFPTPDFIREVTKDASGGPGFVIVPSMAEFTAQPLPPMTQPRSRTRVNIGSGGTMPPGANPQWGPRRASTAAAAAATTAATTVNGNVNGIGVIDAQTQQQQQQLPAVRLILPSEVNADALRDLMDMGFGEVRARNALAVGRNRLEIATEWLLAHQDDPAADTEIPEAHLRAITQLQAQAELNRRRQHQLQQQAQHQQQQAQQLHQQGLQQRQQVNDRLRQAMARHLSQDGREDGSLRRAMLAPMVMPGAPSSGGNGASSGGESAGTSAEPSGPTTLGREANVPFVSVGAPPYSGGTNRPRVHLVNRPNHLRGTAPPPRPGSSEPAVPGLASIPPPPTIPRNLVQMLVDMGFPEADAIRALRSMRLNVDAAATMLLEEQSGAGAPDDGALEGDGSIASAAFQGQGWPPGGASAGAGQPQQQQQANQGAFEMMGNPMMQALLRDPAIVSVMSNPRVFAAFREIMQDPSVAERYMTDPEIGPLLGQLRNIFGGAGAGAENGGGQD